MCSMTFNFDHPQLSRKKKTSETKGNPRTKSTSLPSAPTFGFSTPFFAVVLAPYKEKRNVPDTRHAPENKLSTRGRIRAASKLNFVYSPAIDTHSLNSAASEFVFLACELCILHDEAIYNRRCAPSKYHAQLAKHEFRRNPRCQSCPFLYFLANRTNYLAEKSSRKALRAVELTKPTRDR